MENSNPLTVRPVINHDLTKSNGAVSLEELANSSLADEATAPYDGQRFELHGKNRLQAAIATLAEDASNGDPEARKELLDRVLGKPLQRQDIKQTSVTLVGFLDQLATEEGIIVDANQSNPPGDVTETQDGVPVLFE
jgi:hypothetical protein